MKKLKVLILTVLLSVVSTSLLSAQDLSIRSQRLEVHVMPLSLLDFSPRLRLGTTYTVNDLFSVCLDVGYGRKSLTGGSFWENQWSDQYRFLEIRPEFRYHFYRSKRGGTSLYTALEFFHQSTQDQFTNSSYTDIDGDDIDFESAKYRKLKQGVHVKFGTQVIISKRVDFDFYVGLGTARRRRDYYDVVNPVVQGNGGDLISLDFNNFTREDDSMILHLATGFRFGVYLFNQEDMDQ